VIRLRARLTTDRLFLLPSPIPIVVEKILLQFQERAESSSGDAMLMWVVRPRRRARKLVRESLAAGAEPFGDVRTSLIGIIASAYCWDLDPDFRGLSNPWSSLVDLFAMGYTASGEDDPDGDGLTLTMGYKNGIASCRVI
jgi:hypothetical protein